jgi:hypothetical protein
MLAGHPALQRRVELAERVGGRRWTLRLAGGGSIELPAEGEAEALAHAERLVDAVPARASEIDLRVASRTLLRDGPGRSRQAEQAEHAPDAQLVTGGI